MKYEELLKNALTIDQLIWELNKLSINGHGGEHIAMSVNGNVCYANTISHDGEDYVINAICV